MFAATDSHGYLTIYGFGNDDNYKRIPRELFFHTDYRPLMHDTNGYAIDEQTQQLPHLMQPPFIVDADGNPYSAELQRLVPGRENLTDAQLAPHIITNENGVSEIIGERELDHDQENAETDEPAEPIRAARPQTQHQRLLKDLIRPLDPVLLKTNEDVRLAKLQIEEDYFVVEYGKQLEYEKQAKQNHSDFLDCNENSNSNYGKKRRGKQKRNFTESVNELVQRNRFRAHDTDEEGLGGEIIRHSHNMDVDEDTADQYIDIDDDSNTQHSTAANATAAASSAMHPTTSSRANNRNSVGATTATPNADYDPFDLMSDSVSSEYSDWAEEDGRKTLRAPPRRGTRRTNRKNTKRPLKIEDDDEDNEEDNDRDVEVEDEQQAAAKSSKSRARTTTAKKLKRIVSSDEEEGNTNGKKESEEEEDEYSSDEGGDDDLDESVDSSRPCTSSAAKKSPKKRGRKPKPNKLNKYASTTSTSGVSSKSAPGAKAKSKVNLKSEKKFIALKECPAEYRPPEWLTGTKPRKSPYVPQIGDEVIYFRQGHELYIDAVKKNAAYADIDDKSCPWISNSRIGIQVVCKVMGLKIEIKPPRLVCLKLCVIDPETNSTTNTKFTIKYHDMPGVVDFVILRQFYNRAIEKDWRSKDRFRCIIDDVWWIGVIDSKKPFQDEHPESQFQSLKISWDNGEAELMSPWDLEPLSGVNARKTKPVSSSALPSAGECMQVTIEEVKSLLYTPELGEWPEEGRDSVCERILNGLERIMELSIAEPFNYPVDLDSFPDYAMLIEYPMDLNTIKERLENRFYRRISSVEWDIRKIEKNAVAYNEPKSEIVAKAKFLTDLLIEFIHEPHCTNPMPIYKRMAKEKKVPIGEVDLNDTERSMLNNALIGDEIENEYDDNFNQSKKNSGRGGRGRRTINQTGAESSTNNKSQKSQKQKSWRELASILIDDLIKHADSEPFRTPVDRGEYPDYFEIIDRPIDLGTIKKNLDSNVYANDLSKFETDCKLIFLNSKTFNTNKRSPIYGMTLRLQSFYDNRIKDIIEAHKQTRSEETTSKYGRPRKTRNYEHDLYYEDKLDSSSASAHLKGSKTKVPSSRHSKEPNEERVLTIESLASATGAFSSFGSSTRTRRSTRYNFNANENSQSQSDMPTTSKSSNQLDRSMNDEDLDNTNNQLDDSESIHVKKEDGGLNSSNNQSEEQLNTTAENETETIGKYATKNRISRADSETVLSFNDAKENESSFVVQEKHSLLDEDANRRSVATTSAVASSSSSTSKLNGKQSKRGRKKLKKKKFGTDDEEENDDESDEDFKEKDYDEEYEEEEEEEEENYDDKDLYDNEDEDENYSDAEAKSNKKNKGGKRLSNNNRDLSKKVKNGKSVNTRLRSNRSLDDKENEDDYSKSKSNSKRSKRNRQTRFSYREASSSSDDPDEEFSNKKQKVNGSRKRRRFS